MKTKTKPSAQSASLAPTTYRVRASAAIDNLELDKDTRSALNALIGVGGFAKRGYLSDPDLIDYARAALCSLVEAELAKLGDDASLLKIEATDDRDHTSYRDPVIRSRVSTERLRRTFEGTTTICMALPRVVLDVLGGGKGLITRARAIGIVGSRAEAAEAHRAANLKRAFANSFHVKPLTVQMHNASEVARAVDWLLKPALDPLGLVRDGAVTRLRSVEDETSFDLRTLEALSQIDLRRALIGGGEGNRIVKALKVNIEHWIASRVVRGRGIAASTDVWPFWAAARRKNGPKSVHPMRFDLPVPAPIKVKSPKPGAGPEKGSTFIAPKSLKNRPGAKRPRTKPSNDQ